MQWMYADQAEFHQISLHPRYIFWRKDKEICNG